MAQREKKYSHIMVSSDEEEDFVIEAGVRRNASEQGCESDTVAQEAGKKKTVVFDDGSIEQDIEKQDRTALFASDKDNTVSDGGGEYSVSDEMDAPDTSGTQDTSKTSDTSGTLEAPSTTDAPRTQTTLDTASTLNDTSSTTLEELESTPMSKMQKAILAVALLMMVVAVVYYFVFM